MDNSLIFLFLLVHLVYYFVRFSSNLYAPYMFFNLLTFSGEKPTAESVADAIANNRAELVHLPSSLDFQKPLPSKECPTCDGTVGVKFQDNLTFHPTFCFHE